MVAVRQRFKEIAVVARRVDDLLAPYHGSCQVMVSRAVVVAEPLGGIPKVMLKWCPLFDRLKVLSAADSFSREGVDELLLYAYRHARRHLRTTVPSTAAPSSSTHRAATGAPHAPMAGAPGGGSVRPASDSAVHSSDRGAHDGARVGGGNDAGEDPVGGVAVVQEGGGAGNEGQGHRRVSQGSAGEGAGGSFGRCTVEGRTAAASAVGGRAAVDGGGRNNGGDGAGGRALGAPTSSRLLELHPEDAPNIWSASKPAVLRPSPAAVVAVRLVVQPLLSLPYKVVDGLLGPAYDCMTRQVDDLIFPPAPGTVVDTSKKDHCKRLMHKFRQDFWPCWSSGKNKPPRIPPNGTNANKSGKSTTKATHSTWAIPVDTSSIVSMFSSTHKLLYKWDNAVIPIHSVGQYRKKEVGDMIACLLLLPTKVDGVAAVITTYSGSSWVALCGV